MAHLNLLVVDDDSLVRDSIKISLPENWQAHTFENPKDIPKHKHFNAAIVDMHLSGNTDVAEGVDVIASLRKSDPHLEIIAMSGDLDRELMEACLKAGASRFLAKPMNFDELKITLEKIEAYLLLQGARGRSQNTTAWVGNSKSSQNLKKIIADMTGEAGPILIEGESGTGKEVTSQLLHQQRSNAPFVPVNVAGLSESLFESEFFGHVKGAFTGADQNKMGLAEAAHGGDLFLDEIEALSLNMQVKLLRFLESGEIKRVGAKESIHVKCRVILATNQKLENLVEEKKFREDLLWRINGKKISLPPLRERKADIPQLAKHFLGQDRVRKKEISPEAIEALESYEWPGNIRELKRVCEQLLVSCPLPIIRAEDVDGILKPQSSTSVNSSSIDFKMGLPDLIKNYESFAILTALEKYKDIDETAKILKISRSSLYKKIKDHNIDWRD